MTPTPEISNVLLTGFCLLCTQSQSQRLQSFSIGNFGFLYLCVFYEEIKNHPVSFYIHSSNALGEPALILINPLGRSICLEKKYFMNVFITKLCLFWTRYLIPKQDIVLS